MITPSDYREAPCLVDGPIAQSARKAVLSARRLGTHRWSSVIRSWSVPYLFSGMETIFYSNSHPINPINELLQQLADFMDAAYKLGSRLVDDSEKIELEDNRGDIQAVTGEHYGQLFKSFSQESFWDEPLRLLRVRLERNGIDIALINSKDVLDAGCGGGRYTVAWRLLGAKQVVGVDISRMGVLDAKQRVRTSNIPGAHFLVCNVLKLSFPNDSFDVVFSNGVLHHTLDWKKGIGELVRVLKPGGLGWLYLIEKPGGLFWDIIEVLRIIMKNESKDLARASLHMLGIPSNRIFYMLDHVMVPINTRLTPGEVEEQLRRSGAINIRRLTRGTNFDRVERIYQKEPFADIKYGVGENRYVFSKR